MSEQNQSSEKNRQEDTGQTGGEQQGKDAGQKSTVDKWIDKAQEKGLPEKAANAVKRKLRGR